jgi:dihydroceramidase
VFGYLLWQMDFIFCAELTVLKRKLGIPWGFLLELHGWWHVLTAIGAYTFMHLVDVLTRQEIEFSSDDFDLFGAKTAIKEE